MATFITPEKISLKNHPEVKEDDIQAYIYENPSVLGLGDLSAIRREKIQPTGGRLDILLTGEDNTRYETEVQLGATDPSHIIRTIEYWDNEKKRFPQYDHIAVIVAEDITARFLNVISLFNGALPLIAIKMTAYKKGDDIELTFTKVIDRIIPGTEEEDQTMPTDRKYWEKRSTPDTLKQMDLIFEDIRTLAPNIEPKYNKYYVGVSVDGSVKNFFSVRPKKNFLYLDMKGNLDEEMLELLENEGVDVSFDSRWKEYNIKLKDYKEYEAHIDNLRKMVQKSLEYFNID